jgi:hypothetical protein
MKKIFEFISKPIREFFENRRLKKKIEEMRKRDPFIYK